MSKLEPFRSPPWRTFVAVLAALVLAACSSTLSQPVENAVAPSAALRDAADVRRIDELERQLSDQQGQLQERERQLSERPRQMAERRRQHLEERQRLERELKESQDLAEDLRKKLDSVLAIDRQLRRGSKAGE